MVRLFYAHTTRSCHSIGIWAQPEADRIKLHTIMKTIRIITGLLAAYALIIGLVVLFKQPFHTNQTNDNVFCTMFGIGMALVLIFLKVENNKEDESNCKS
jgi:predicted membrane channel-forming protein YqfA (hemolysin III family)